MAPDVSGRIVELDVRNNQKVHRGQVLFRIDPEPYRLHVDQARATVLGLEATLAVTADQVASLGLGLTRFGGHPEAFVRGAADAKNTPTIFAGISPTDGRPGPCWP